MGAPRSTPRTLLRRSRPSPRARQAWSGRRRRFPRGVEAEARGMTVSCFLWAKQALAEEEQRVEVWQMVARCEEHIFFKDTGTPGGAEDAVRVLIPKQDLEREDSR
ncbi:unnamed protein product [Prorocentrum cordatum]|uniref:Uncharacterized protein n=1 Tax=Prorocentrum cordatum TaxID=2364126 RepID=A0ABN9UHP8_9DINO|nr:unnamed protein product [Polarella glacialis]